MFNCSHCWHNIREGKKKNLCCLVLKHWFANSLLLMVNPMLSVEYGSERYLKIFNRKKKNLHFEYWCYRFPITLEKKCTGSIKSCSNFKHSLIPCDSNIKLFSSVGVINTFRVTLRAGGAGEQKNSGISSRTPQKEWNQFSWTKTRILQLWVTHHEFLKCHI